MFKIIEDGIVLPQIDNTFNWYIDKFKFKTKFLTYIDADDIKNLDIHKKRPHFTFQKQGTIWSTPTECTFLNYINGLENLGSHSVLSLDHVIWITEHKNHLLNTTEKNDKDQYIGNFFFIPKNEFHKENEVWNGEIVVASVMRRNNTPNLEFGMRFYDIKDPRIWKAKDRRIISLS